MLNASFFIFVLCGKLPFQVHRTPHREW